MSRFPAEVVVTTTDGRTLVECFNQTQMAQFTHALMLASIQKGEAVTVFDAEPFEIPAERVATLQVVVQETISA